MDFQGDGYYPDNHGTSVASVLFSIAPDIKLYSAKVFSTKKSGTLTTVLKAIEWCIVSDIDLVNISFTIKDLSVQSIVEHAVGSMLARGIWTICSAGNYGSRFMGLPARLDSVLTVGAWHKNNPASFSSRWGNKPDCYYWGINVEVAKLEGYGTMSGTSISTPFATGLLALAREYGILDWNLVKYRLKGKINPTTRDLKMVV